MTGSGQRVALLIATSSYVDTKLGKLRAPAGEAEQLKETLDEQGDFDRVEVLRNESKRGIEGAIETAFSAAGPADLVLLYLSCHGVKNDRGDLLFAACNTELDELEATAVSSSFIHSQLRRSQAGAKLLLLDCCYSGAFSRSLVPKSSTHIDLHQLASRGTYIITATSSAEYAFEGDHVTSSMPGPSSVFTRALLAGIRTGEADADRDGLITADELYNYVFRELGELQTPSREAHTSGDLPVARTGAASRAKIRDAPPAPAIDDSLGALLTSTAAKRNGPAGTTLRIPVGLQSSADPRTPFFINLTEPEDHWSVTGPAQSGKSQFLRTLLLSLIADSDPSEVQIHVVDSENRFSDFAEFAHVAEVAGPEERERIEQTIRTADQAIPGRRSLFRENKLGSAFDFRTARRNRDLPLGAILPDIFLVIDRWETFADENPELAERIAPIADRGTHFGIHFLVATRFWESLPRTLSAHLRGWVDLSTAQPFSSDEHGQTAISPRGAFQVAAPTWKHSEHATPRQSKTSLVEAIQRCTRPEGLETAPNPSRVLELEQGTDTHTARRTPEHSEWLRTPIGVDAFGRKVELDLNASGDSARGRHGMIIGSTGSGATQTLNSVLRLLMASHAPADLNIALLRGPYNAYADLPRTSHIVLSPDSPRFEGPRLAGPHLLDLHREIIRREHDAVTEPALVVAIHNFTDLVGFTDLTSNADDNLQRLREILLRGPTVGLRVLLHGGVAAVDADPTLLEFCDFQIVHHIRGSNVPSLPTPAATDVPGIGYLKERTHTPLKFRSWDPDQGAWWLLTPRSESNAGKPFPLHSPLASPFTLNHVLGTLARTSRGLSAPDYDSAANVPVGLVDAFHRGKIETLTVPVTDNIKITGPDSGGKGFLARSLVLSMTLTRTPEELRFFFISNTRHASCAEVFNDLPHVGATASAETSEREFAYTTVRYLRDLLAFRCADTSHADTHDDVIVVIEQWHELRVREPELVDDLRRLARDGSEHRIHVVCSSAAQPAEDDFQELFGTHIHLHGEPPGTGTIEGLRLRVALPWIDRGAHESPQEATRRVAQNIASSWPGQRATGPSLPPTSVTYQEAAALGSPHMVLGLSAHVDGWETVDLHQTPHLLCLGERESGKTNFLRLVLHEIRRTHNTGNYRVAILDPKRDLLGDVARSDCNYAAVGADITQELERILQELQERIAAQQQGLTETWNDLFLVLSDFELLSEQSTLAIGYQLPRAVLSRLARVVDKGAEVGLHLVVTRNSVNVGNALEEGLLGQMRSAGCATIVLSTDARESPLVPGIRAQEQPPGRGHCVLPNHMSMIQLARVATS